MRLMVRPIMHGISRLAQQADVDPLDADEIASGEIAFSALLYQYGGMLDARVLVVLWLAGVSVSRVPQYIAARNKKAEEKPIVPTQLTRENAVVSTP